MREPLHFVHGNGFPSPCYQQLLSRLEERFNCCYIERVGHDHRFPVTENWRALVDEVILSIRSQTTQPVIAVGHSLGGILSLLASIEQPALFKSVILLDSPLLGRLKSSILRLSKLLGVVDHVTPAFRTRGRREHWQTREEAFAYLKSRRLFKYFTTACLNDYIEYGLNKDESGYTLRFDPRIEYQIYRTIPHVLYRYKGALSVPSALIYGDKSNVINQADIQYMKTHHQIASFKTNGTHMFPMEHPDATADLIFQVLGEMAI